MRSPMSNQKVLLAVGRSPVVFQPSDVISVGLQVLADDAMMDAELSPLEAAEIRFSLVGAGFPVRISFAVIDPLGQESHMQRVPP